MRWLRLSRLFFLLWQMLTDLDLGSTRNFNMDYETECWRALTSVSTLRVLKLNDVCSSLTHEALAQLAHLHALTALDLSMSQVLNPNPL